MPIAMSAGPRFTTHAAYSVPGREGRNGTSNAASMYAVAGRVRVAAAAMPRNTQPMTLPALVTISRPRVEKPPMTTSVRIPKNTSGPRPAPDPKSAPAVARSRIARETRWTTRASRALRLVGALT